MFLKFSGLRFPRFIEGIHLLTIHQKRATLNQKVATKEEIIVLSAGIKDLKNNLSQYLSSVKKGEDVLITERGKIIARIIREESKNSSWRQALSHLMIKGLVALPSQKIDKDVPAPVELPGKPISEMAIEDRR
jgi:prevent-host-death family protein